jgi:hypothetical protein
MNKKTELININIVCSTRTKLKKKTRQKMTKTKKQTP